ncbi:MAG TPA: polymorphic toxin type 15 domain-containing protein [Puia sp.]|jgi:hypothetical protein|nr:polymorphic toxin type 15 domain-containing protein [Puia sp.]
MNISGVIQAGKTVRQKAAAVAGKGLAVAAPKVKGIGKASGPVAKVAAVVAKAGVAGAAGAAGAKAPATEAGAEGVMAAPVEAKKPAADVMEADKGFQTVKTKIGHDATKARQHEGGAKKAADAQSAARGPAGETMSKAKDKQSDAMDQQEPGTFSQEKFKAALREKISALKIDTLEDADNFKKNDGASAVKGDMAAQVDSEKEAAAGGMTSTVQSEPDAGSEQPKVAGPDPVVAPGVTTAPVDGQAAAPKPVSDADISMQKDSQELDHQLADAKVTEKQLNKSNEPGFTKAVQSKAAAQKDAVEQPVQFRKTEKVLVAQSQTAAVGTAHTHMTAMVAGRNKHMAGVLEKQNATKAKDEENRKKVSDDINSKFDVTKKDVEGILAQLDKDASKCFDDGIADATKQFEEYVDQKMDAYKDDRYSGVIGKGKWVKDKFADLPDEVNVFYKDGKALYIKIMDGVIDRVAKIVADGLNAAKKRINAGKLEIKKYVESLPKDLQNLGQEAAKDISSKFTELENTVSSKEGELVDSLAQKYKAGMEAVNKRIAEMKEANKGWISKAKAFIADVINTIIQLKNMLLNVLAKAAAAIDLIIEDPIGFLGHLVDGVKMGIKNFVGNIVSHLKEGLMGWLFGAIADAGIEIPKSFDLKGIISLILQVLGLTYRNIRARAVNIVGEKVVSMLEKAAEIFIVIKNEGIGGLWRFIVEKVTALKDTVMDSIKDFVITKIITAGVTWLISLLNPASAFIKACKAIYDVIMFFVERGKQILTLVNAVIDSVTAIAKGAISVAATMVENALAKALPVAISFLASLLGLDGISEKIKSIIEKIQEPINKVIDWVITKAVGLVKAAGKLLGIGGKDEKHKDEKGKENEDGQQEHSPEKQAKIDAGILYMREERQQYIKDGGISKDDADKVAAGVKGKHPVFSSFIAREKGEKIQFVYTASPERVVDEMKDDEFPKEVSKVLKIGVHIHYVKGEQMKEEEKKQEDGKKRQANVYVIHSVEGRTHHVFLMASDGYVKKPMTMEQFVQQYKDKEFKIVTGSSAEPSDELSPFGLVTLKFYYRNSADEKVAADYERQVLLQQRGLNAMSVASWDEHKKLYEVRKDEGESGRDPRSDQAQQWARDDYRKQRAAILEMQDPAPASPAKTARIANMVEVEMEKMDALHSSDQVAGGHFKGITGLGLSYGNRSMGSQWARQDKASEDDEAAKRNEKLQKAVKDYMKDNKFKKPPTEEQKKIKLNVEMSAERRKK